MYSDSACTNAISSMTVMAGTASVALYLKDFTSESLTLTATSSNLTTAVFSLAILSSNASKLSLSGPSLVRRSLQRPLHGERSR